MACFYKGRCDEDTGQRSILYDILNKDAQPDCRKRGCRKAAAAHRTCSCASNRKAVIRAPQRAFKASSVVLLKTFRFVKNVPCFRGLPADDQLRLVRSGWAPLLVLGMAQDSVDFDTVETQEPSLLHRILTGCEDEREPPDQTRDRGVPVADVQGIKRFLIKCRDVCITIKEYAYLKGTVLFNPDVTELECRGYIQALQSEAQSALYGSVAVVQRGDATRFAKLCVVLSMLRSVNADAVAGLFFQPVIGASSVDAFVLTLFYES
ncbi:nuclear receptor subfamily 0 group B member 1-like [Polymixia lowei]